MEPRDKLTVYVRYNLVVNRVKLIVYLGNNLIVYLRDLLIVYLRDNLIAGLSDNIR